MAYINIRSVSLAFSVTRLFKEINLTVEQGEKVALVGRNGSGKSTLLKLVMGKTRPDSGTVAIQKGIRAAYLDQIVPGEIPGTVLEVVTGESSRVHDTSDTEKVWKLHQQAEKITSQLGLDTGVVFNTLSAGMKRKVLLAKAFIDEPDILLLDEPTNHMDIDSIKRLEEVLLRFTGALIFVTHDRMFLQRIATRIVEIDRGGLFDQSCDYETFLKRREEARENEETRNALFDKKLQQEERWVREGVKARRTRNEGRVRALLKMRELWSQRRERSGTIKIANQQAKQSGKLVVEAEDINFSYGNSPVISNLSTMIMKGDRVGILGPNGSGKTTLLRLLLGELQPDSGSIRLGSNLQISYFDQLREQLDDNKTVQQNVAEDNQDIVFINGKQRHIIGYLQDLLFSPDQARSYVSKLSGGERSRLLLAKQFVRPSNIMVLDEPTNDLDVETLEVLEEYLLNYPGTILLVSHDRAFINNVVTSTLVFEGSGIVKEYVGGYDDWQRQRQVETKSAKTSKGTPAVKATRPKTRFGFRQKKELEELPHTIEAMETEQKELYKAMADPELYKNEKSGIVRKTERLEELKKLLAESYARWEELEDLKNEPGS
ncbi:MAG: ATP-binding cassette domain-containing protein [Candidatus Desulfatibia sp.]|uniref:ATP-binding cassette domain-containing protein n=1 Tax=Candidatus Desulfatibia sp. TaxID=3101189 RepID=UPI002F2D08E5